MRLQIEQSEEYDDVSVIIKCSTVDAQLERLIEQIRLYGFALQGKANGVTTLIQPEEVLYFESIDGKTFIYQEKKVYESALRLYEIEDRLCRGYFVRVSKSTILNIQKLKSFRTQLNGKLEALLLNGERIEINRHYVTELKTRLAERRGVL